MATPLKSLTLFDKADLSLLHTVDNIANGSGTTTFAIATILEVEPRCVGSRLSWMRRYELVTRDDKGAWYLTSKARRILRDPKKLEEISAVARGVNNNNETLRWMAKRVWRREFR